MRCASSFFSSQYRCAESLGKALRFQIVAKMEHAIDLDELCPPPAAPPNLAPPAHPPVHPCGSEIHTDHVAVCEFTRETA